MTFDFSNQPGRVRRARFKTDEISPRVTIVTPYYNAGEFFEQTFNCVINQTFPYFEWIIVDDVSPDRAAVEKMLELSATDSRVKTFTMEHNSGPAAVRNFGARQAKSEMLVFLDADDLIEPTFLESLYFALQYHPKAQFAYSDVVTFGAKEFLWARDFSSEQMREENLLVVTGMIRRKAFLEVGGFDVMGRYYNEDWDFWLKLLAKGYVPVRVPMYLFWYRNLCKGAMNALDSDPELTAKNREKIAQQASRVPDGIRAIVHNGELSRPFADLPQWAVQSPLPFAKKKIHILLLLPHMVMGGADQFNLDLLARLNPEEFEVSILTTLPEENDWQQRFAEYVDDIFVLPKLLDMHDWPCFMEYMMQTRQIDVIFNTNSYYSYYLLPWLSLRWPNAAVVDYIHMEEWYYRGGGFARPSGAVGPFLDKTYVCNERTRKVLIEHFGRAPETVETVYIGVDEKKYDPQKADVQFVYQQLEQLPKDKPVVLFPCRICDQKRPFLMLEIAKRTPQYSYVVVGDGPLLEPLIQKAKEERVDNLYFAGRQSDMRPFYKAAAVTMICSLKEGLALTAYESLSMETPVVTSDVGGQAELVNEEVGVVVPLLQSEAEDATNYKYSEQEIGLYTEALARLLKDKQQYGRYCKACRQRILSGFTVDQMGRKMAQELKRLTGAENQEHRKQIAQRYAPLMFGFEHMADLISSYENLERCYVGLDGLYRQEKNRFETEAIPAIIELNRIQKMRTFRLAEYYRRLVNNSFLGTIRRMLGRLLHRR